MSVLRDVLPRPTLRGGSRRAEVSTMVAIAVLGLFVLLAVAADWLYPDVNAISVTDRLQSPSWSHPLGTDELGRDLLGRIAHAGRLTLVISATAAALSVGLGLIWGMVSAVFGAWVDELLMRVADAVMAIPVVLFGLVCVAALGSSVGTLIIVLGLLLAPLSARVFRAATLTELKADYVRGVVAVGVPKLRIIFGEVLPNVMPVLIAQVILNVASAILVEASLSFVGLGIQPPQASWGSLLKSGYDLLFQAPWFALAAAIAIVAMLAALNVVGESLQKRWKVDAS